MTGSQEVAATAVDNIDSLVTEILEHDYADNEVSLGRIIAGKQEMQVVLKVVAVRESEKQECDHDWEKMGGYSQCTYSHCQAVKNE